jgi:NifU-like protein involved in Fe-S cluster formation
MAIAIWCRNPNDGIGIQERPEVMIDDVYNARILDFAGNIPRIGTLEDADAEASAHSKLCGSKVKVWLKMDGDLVADFAQDVKACALGQASSSIMARNIVGASAAELREVQPDHAADAEGKRPGAGRAVCRSQVPRTCPRLQGAACLDASDIRRGGRLP